MATLSWNRSRPRSQLSFVYNPVYLGRWRLSEFNSFTHLFSFNGSRSVRRENWTVTFQTGAAVNSFEQFFFDAPILSSVPNPPARFEDLVAGADQFTDAELASILTGAPVVEKPGKIDQDLSRVFSSSVGVGASYSYSRRLSLNLGVNGNRNQFLGGRRRGDEDDEILFIEGATAAGASGGLSYELTQRTRLGAGVSVGRNFSPVRNAYTTSETVTLQQQLGRRWSAGVSAGSGSTHDIGGTGSGPRLDRRTWTAAGNLSYSGREHSVGASASRSV